MLLPVWLLSPDAASSVAVEGLPYLLAQVVAGAVAVVLFFRLQRRADAVTMSFVGYVLALTAVLFGALLLDEALPWQLLPADLLIFGGFRLMQRSATPVRPSSPASVPPAGGLRT